MKNLKRELRQEAEEKHGKISLPGSKENLDQCYTEANGKLLFWFNIENKSTKILSREIDN